MPSDATHNHYEGNRPVLQHAHYRGWESHDHSEEIEVVIGRMLTGRYYTGLPPAEQHAVAAGIAAMRAAMRTWHAIEAVTQSDAMRERRIAGLPTTAELRAPLVNRVRGEVQR